MEIALIYVALDRKTDAFEWLETAFAERSDLLIYLNTLILTPGSTASAPIHDFKTFCVASAFRNERESCDDLAGAAKRYHRKPSV